MQLRTLVCASVALATIAAGCSESGGGAVGAVPDATATTAVDPAPAGRALDGTAVLRELRGSMALVETPIVGGSAVLLADGFLVTNAHVVDPFGVADVTFEQEDTVLDVPVVGVDLDADIAVLGPISTDHEPLALADPTALEQGSDLFLVGFPGDQTEPEVTISTGVLSRRRALEDWDLNFVQSDTKIAPGQSGGALVDDRGRVVGISGLADEDDFALSLAGADVAAAVDRIQGGDGSAWTPAPAEASDTAATFRVAGPGDPRTLYLPATEADRTVTVRVDAPAPLVELDDVGYLPLALNGAAADLYGPDGGGPDVDLPEPTAPDADGGYTFDLPGGYPALLQVGADVATATPVKVSTTEPFVVVSGDPQPTSLAVGADPVEGTLDYLDGRAVFDLDLGAGDRIAIDASSAIGDVAYAIVAPGSTIDAADEVDDTGGGLFGADAAGSFTADASGTYQLHVYQVEGVATGYRLTVEAA